MQEEEKEEAMAVQDITEDTGTQDEGEAVDESLVPRLDVS